MFKTIAAAVVATLALTAGAAAGPFDPAYSSRDRQIEAQLRAAPAGEVSAYVPSFDPAADASDDRAIAGGAGATFIATHDVLVSGYIPTIDRAVSERD
jgi:hypothetical protein